MRPGRILLFGTGAFAARIAADIAATALHPVTLLIAGRNADRLAWLETACGARASTFGRPVTVETATAEFTSHDALATLIGKTRPDVVVQAASVQGSAVIADPASAWGRLVAEAGLSATAVFQALISARVGRAVAEAAPGIAFVNACFPDVVNAMLAAAGLPITCGVGNVGILAAAFAARLGPGGAQRLAVLAHYQTIGAFRRHPAQRLGATAPRVWIDGCEVDDVLDRFASVRLTAEPAIEISGSAGVPLLVAMACEAEARAHVPGPFGLPGGYPVRWDGTRLSLDLPPGIAETEAVAWNRSFEERNGLVVEPDGRVRYTGLLHDRLAALSPDLASGFAMADLEAVHAEMAALRARLASA